MKYLVDLNIIIYHLNNEPIATQFLRENYQQIAISNQAIKNRKIKKIKLPDNLIVSTAMVNDLILVTRNVKDFKTLDIKVLNIFKV